MPGGRGPDVRHHAQCRHARRASILVCVFTLERCTVQRDVFEYGGRLRLFHAVCVYFM